MYNNSNNQRHQSSSSSSSSPAAGAHQYQQYPQYPQYPQYQQYTNNPNSNNGRYSINPQQVPQYQYQYHYGPPPSTTSEIPQSPFDLSYGNSLLPHQLLISSPFVSITPSPLHSPAHPSFNHHHHHHHQQQQQQPVHALHAGHPGLSYQRQGSLSSQNGGGVSAVNQNYYYSASPKLHMPSENPRFRRTLQKRPTKTSLGEENSSMNGQDDLEEEEAEQQREEDDEDEDDLESVLRQDTPSKIISDKNLKRKVVAGNPSSGASSSLDLNDFNLHKGPKLFTNSVSSVTSLSSNDSIQVSKLPTRSIIFLNVNTELSLTEFLDNITFGPIDNVRLIENYPFAPFNSFILTFYKAETCSNFYNNLLTYFATFKKAINSVDLKLQFVSTPKLNSFILNAITNDGATRNVYIGNLNGLELAESEEINEGFIKNHLLKFGIIDKIEIIEKQKSEDVVDKFAFVHFANIAAAIKCVEQLNLVNYWSQCKIFFGTDRCSLQNDSSLKSITDEETESTIDGGEQIDAFGVLSCENDEYDDPFYDADLYQQPLYFVDSNSQIPVYPSAELNSIQYMTTNPSTPQVLSRFVSVSSSSVPPPPLSTSSSSSAPTAAAPLKNPLLTDEVTLALSQKNLTTMSLASSSVGPENIGNRTICIGNIGSNVKIEDMCNVIRGGILQQIKIFHEKKVCFITFIDSNCAAQFFANSILVPIKLHGKRLKIGWGNHSGPLPNSIALAVTVGASRNIYIGLNENDELNELPSEEEIRRDMKKYGDIEQINFFKQNRCVFVNFLNIVHAMKVVNDLEQNPDKFHLAFHNKYKPFKFSYGKDRCGNPPRPQTGRGKKGGRKRREKSTGQEQEKHGYEHERHEDKEKGQDQEQKEVPSGLWESIGITTSKPSEENPSIKEEINDAFGISTTPSSKTSTLKSNSATPNLTIEDSFENVHEEEDNSDVCTVRSFDSSDIEVITESKSPDGARTSESSQVPGHHHHHRPHQTKRDFSKNNQNQRQYNGFARHNGSTQPIINQHILATRLHTPQQHRQLYQYHPYQHHQHPQQGIFMATTTGSQVMAQYLAQSQQSQLAYAANVLNAAGGGSQDGCF